MEFGKLKRLNLSHNKIKSVTRTTEDNIAVNSLQSLDLSFNNLQVIHPLGGIYIVIKAGLYLSNQILPLFLFSVGNVPRAAAPEPLPQQHPHRVPGRLQPAQPPQHGYVTQQHIRGLLLHV